MRTQKDKITVKEIMKHWKSMNKTLKDPEIKNKHLQVLYYAKNFESTSVSCELKEVKRKFKNGYGNAIGKVKLEFDLSKSKYPWQPHTEQAGEFAEELIGFICERYQEYCENMGQEISLLE